ncbi:MAG: hypothetical protein WDO73_25165 [Ignavibacteriota bacterium]
MLRNTKRELTLCEHKASHPEMAAPRFSPDTQRLYFQSDRGWQTGDLRFAHGEISGEDRPRRGGVAGLRQEDFTWRFCCGGKGYCEPAIYGRIRKASGRVATRRILAGLKFPSDSNIAIDGLHIKISGEP